MFTVCRDQRDRLLSDTLIFARALRCDSWADEFLWSQPLARLAVSIVGTHPYDETSSPWQTREEAIVSVCDLRGQGSP